MPYPVTINGQTHLVDAPEGMPLLWVLRDILGMTGTKYGCGVAACGACTVMMDGTAWRSCQLPIEAVEGEITTIEGIGTPDLLAPIQAAWITHQVAQCGWCQSGQIMQAAALLAEVPNPDDAQIDEAMAGNLCRCGTYPRIRAAIHTAAAEIEKAKPFAQRAPLAPTDAASQPTPETSQ
jgi:isoquinoline 1-oxidoreductase alpha subunit